MTTVDILVPHHNDPDGLRLSLLSIARQDWQGEKRIVVVDDGSSAATRDAVGSILAEYATKPDISGSTVVTLIENGVNRGRPHTRNVLLDAIESPYVAWLDAGDEWYPTKLSAQFRSLRTLDATGGVSFWITCHYDWRWSGGDSRLRRQRTVQDQHKALLTGQTLRAYLWTLLGPAESFKCVGYFDERLPRMQDLDYFIRFVSHGGIIHSVDDETPHCVYHKSDLGRNADEVWNCNALIYDKHRVIYNRYGPAFGKMHLFNMDMLAARFAQNNGDDRKTRAYMWSACKNRPWPFLKHLYRNGWTA